MSELEDFEKSFGESVVDFSLVKSYKLENSFINSFKLWIVVEQSYTMIANNGSVIVFNVSH